MSDEWFALDQIETTFFIAGVYEIENVKDNRIYVGESVNIHARIIGHLNDLRSGRHNNKAMQLDWDRLLPSDFRMRVVEVLAGSGKQERLDAESAQEDKRREDGYSLYADIGVKEEDTEEPEPEPEPEVDGIPLSAYIDILKHPLPKKEVEYMDCVECERRGKEGFIECDDDKIRCEDCAKERSEKMAKWILSMPTENRTLDGAVWRRTIDDANFKNQVVMGMVKFAKKFDNRPETVLVNRTLAKHKKKEIAGAVVEIGSWTPAGYIDFPLPDGYDRQSIDQ